MAGGVIPELGKHERKNAPRYRAGTGSVEEQIWSFFRGKGLSEAATAGIIGNLKQESGLNPHEGNGGLAQWLPNGSRFPGAENHTLNEQLNQIWKELAAGYGGTLSRLKTAKSPQDAAVIFSKYFEQPSVPMIQNRERYATEAYKNHGGNPQEAGAENTTLGIWPEAEKVAEAPVTAAEEAKSGVESVGSFFETLTDPQTWLRLAEGLGGLFVVYLGVKTLTTGNAKPTVNVTGFAAAYGKHIAAGVAK